MKVYTVVALEEHFEKHLNEKIEEIERNGISISDIKFTAIVDKNSYAERDKLSALIICE